MDGHMFELVAAQDHSHEGARAQVWRRVDQHHIARLALDLGPADEGSDLGHDRDLVIDRAVGLVGDGHAALPPLLRLVGRRYREELKNCAHVGGGSFWLYGVLINHRDERAEELLAAGIDVNMVHLRNDKYKLFGGQAEDLPNMEYVEDRYLYLPINSHLTDDDVDTVVKEFNRIVTD